MRIVPPAPAPPPEEPPELIFQWERPSHVHWRLLGIIALSLLVHAVSFYVLQVAYTPTGSQLPPPAQVMMVPLNQPGNDAFARWLAMADPSLVVQPAAPSPGETLAALDFRYVPSYKAAQPGFKSLDPLPGEEITTAPPRPRPPGPLPLDLFAPGRTNYLSTRPAGSQRTRVLLTDGLEPLLSAALPPVRFKTLLGSEPVEPTAFLVGVRAEGGAPFLFLKSRPGNAFADDYAQSYLARLRFQPGGAPLGKVLWGTAEFAWGNDIYLPRDDRK